MGRPPDCDCRCGPVNPPDPPSTCSCPDKGWYEQFQSATREKLLVIQICNDNNARDDDVIVKLNGTIIDPNLDLNENRPVGKIYVSDSTVIDDNDPLLICRGENHAQLEFSPTLLYPAATNAITTELLNDNNNGNRGGVIVISYDYPYVAGQGCVIFDDIYGGPPDTFNFKLCKQPFTVTMGQASLGEPYLVRWRESPDGALPGNQVANGSIFNVYEGVDIEFYIELYDLSCNGGFLIPSLWQYRTPGGSWTNNAGGFSSNTPFPYTVTGDVEIRPVFSCAFA